MIKTLKKKKVVPVTVTVAWLRSHNGKVSKHEMTYTVQAFAQKWYLNGTPFSGDTEMNDVQMYEM